MALHPLGSRILNDSLHFSTFQGVLCTLLTLSAICCAEEADDPTAPRSTLVALTAPDQSLDMPAPASQFVPGDGEKLWNEARVRAAQALPEQGAGFFNVAERLPEGFRMAR